MSGEDLRLRNTLTKRRAAFAKVISVEETERSHVSSDRQRKKLVSERLANQVLGTLFYAVKKLEVSFGGSSPQMAAVFHQRTDGCLVKVQNTLWSKIASCPIETANALSCFLTDGLNIFFHDKFLLTVRPRREMVSLSLRVSQLVTYKRDGR